MNLYRDQQLSQLFTRLPVGVGIYECRDRSLYPVFVNDVTCRYFGISRADYDAHMAGGNPVFVMDDVQAFVQKYAADWDGGPLSQEINFEFRTRRMDGGELWLRVQG